MKAYWYLFVVLFLYCNCGKQQRTIEFSEEEKVCAKALECSLVKEEGLDTCVRCLTDLYTIYEDKIPFTKTLISTMLLQQTCEDIENLGIKYMIFQCIDLGP
jgi:hypothetical protein